MKSLVHDLVVTCDEIVDISRTISASLKGKTNYWLVVSLVIACLLLLVVVVVKYYMKRGSKITCLLSYWHIILAYDRIDIYGSLDINNTSD